MTEDTRGRLNGWVTHPLLELVTKVATTVAAGAILAGTIALFGMRDELTELRTLYGALDGRVESLASDVERIEDRQYRQRPPRP